MDMKLVVFRQDGSRKDIPVKPGTYIVGRNEQASIRIPLPSVSRAHCELVVTDDGARIRDLGSANGTFQNNQRIDQAELAPGDVLAIGDMHMTVQINGEPSNIQPPTKQNHAEEDEQSLTPSSGDSSMMDDGLDPAAASPKPGAPSPLADSSESGFDLSFLDDDDDDNPQL